MESQDKNAYNESKTKKITGLGLFLALGMVFSYLELLIPINVGIPGVKIGLANLVTIIVLYREGTKEAYIIAIVRAILSGLMFSGINMMIYSIAGGILSVTLMVIAKKTKLFSTMGISVIGAIGHNMGQILMAIFIMENKAVIYYLPALMISGVCFGVLIGILGTLLITKVNKISQNH